VDGGLSMDVTAGTVPIDIDTNISSTEGSVDILKAKTINDYYSGVTLVREGTTNTGLAFKTTGSGTYDTRMTIDASGNVGIGTSSPFEKLTVGGADETSLTNQIAVRASDNDDIFRIRTNNSTEQVSIEASGDGGNGFITFGTGSTAGTERMRIDSSGNLLVGLTTGEDALIHAQAPKPTYTDYATVFAGGTDSNNGQHAISLMTSGNGLAGIIGSNLSIDGTTYSQPVTNRSSGYISFSNPTTAGKTSSITFGGFSPGTTTALPKMTLDGDGNLLVGTTARPTSSAGNIVLANGTAPTASATDGVILYAEDVSSSSELKVRDEAGNITTLSPHNFDLIPQGPSEDMAWSYYSERDGKQINVDMLKAIRVLEKLSGEQLVFEN